MTGRTRTKGVNIRLTEQEKKHVMRNAKKCKLGVSEYVRQLVNGYEPKELPDDRIYNLCWQIDLLAQECHDETLRGSLTTLLSDLRMICRGEQALSAAETNTNGNDKDLAGA